MSRNQQIKLAAVRLGVALEERTEAMRCAVGEGETIMTSTDLSIAILENIDFIIFCVKTVAGLKTDKPEPLGAHSGLIKLPSAITGINDDPGKIN